MSDMFIPAALAKELGFEVCKRCDRLFNPDSSPEPETCLPCTEREGGDGCE